MKEKGKNMKYLAVSCASILVVLLIWYICINVMHMKPETVFPGPVKVFKTLVQKFYTKAPDGA